MKLSFTSCCGHHCQRSCFIQTCCWLCPFHDISPCVGGNSCHAISFSHINKLKLGMAKAKVSMRGVGSASPKGRNLLANPPEWHQGFDHPSLSLQTCVLQIYKVSKLWSSLVPSATSMRCRRDLGSGAELKSPAPTSGLISPSAQRWLRLSRVFSRSLCSFWKRFQGRRRVGRAKHSSHEKLLIGERCWWRRPGFFFYRAEQERTLKKIKYIHIYIYLYNKLSAGRTWPK